MATTGYFRDVNTGVIAEFPIQVARAFPFLEQVDPEADGCVDCGGADPEANADPEALKPTPRSKEK